MALENLTKTFQMKEPCSFWKNFSKLENYFDFLFVYLQQNIAVWNKRI